MIFAWSIDIRKGKGVLVETAFTNFKNMSEVCALYAAREYHKDVIAVCDTFVERMSSKRERRARKITQNNRKKLCSITEIIVLCNQQNIAHRGLCDSAQI